MSNTAVVREKIKNGEIIFYQVPNRKHSFSSTPTNNTQLMSNQKNFKEILASGDFGITIEQAEILLRYPPKKE
ncbi:MAG: hypothetical protein AAFP82_07465 [Bacteroidota bacterium]